ncbi:S-layer homology domain-containing protein [Paenibacillus sp. MMS20-IR301]|uniref:S-layer homology domain-containing protein n=1 Tax=Paenibacillus sp. MMS20-IR301 TaxID=2895946 RepID=UPI0028EBEB8F|nr:S-layer homology domain-containing protein [Paenibacillus sp. MMS20-IR301]WNS42910.1 S-layer homology domain-containing protein [Paenibacillus sp. MMS20-IR301]
MAKKSLSMLLAVIMLFTMLPAAVFGAGDTDAVTDTVIYNLGKQEVSVGPEVEAALTDELFAQDGSYTIQLEDNAFFPYEVQFKYNGETTTEWFDTPESSVVIGGHTFYVATEQNDPNRLSQIGVKIGNTYVAAKPEPKNFRPGGGFTAFSMLPLEESRVSLDLSAYSRLDLKAVEVSALLSGLKAGNSHPEIDSNDKVVWARLSNDDYKIVSQSDKIDLSMYQNTYGSFSLELIVGSALQLDPDNIRYIVNVTASTNNKFAELGIYTDSDSTRTKLGKAPYEYYSVSTAYDYYDVRLPKTFKSNFDFYIGLKLPESIGTYDVFVYDGEYDTAALAEAAAVQDPSKNITATILADSYDAVGSGYHITSTYDSSYQRLTFVVKQGNDAVFTQKMLLSINVTSNGPEYYYGLYAEQDGNWNKANGGYSYSSRSGLETVTYEMNAGAEVNDNYHLILVYEHNSSSSLSNAATYVTKAVVGHFDSLESATAEADIKSQLFPSSSGKGNGYLANYSGDGQKFTIFAEGEVFKIIVKTIKGDNPATPDSVIPNPGSMDTNFYIQGARDSAGINLSSKVYAVPYDADTYYDLGFQTLLINDSDVDLSNVKPTFWVNTYAKTKAYIETEQTSGESVVNADPDKGGKSPVNYVAKAENGKNVKEYWVTFAKKQAGGSKLFVNGINGPDGAKREIFLDSIYDYRHDIFIANIGDAELTGLTAKLSDDAAHVKLDEYWTVGGAGNDKLAAFNGVARETSYGEIANVAKIRIVPDGTGDISGKLTISAVGQEDVVITLTGVAGDPKITTDSVPKAVKYVPYSVMMHTSNKYDWNTVKWQLAGGTLPKGMTLYENGELYGVPQETGTFTFWARAEFNPRFPSDMKQFTLNVADNTAEDVFNASDYVTDWPNQLTTINSYADKVFKIEHAFSEFTDKFFLDGKELIKDTDYLAEEGSTKITIRAQTFQNSGSGTHTIAAEFRNDQGKGTDMKKAARNYTLDLNTPSSTTKPSTSGSGSNPTPTPSATPKPTATATPTPKPTATPAPSATPKPTSAPSQAPTSKLYSDVRIADWFRADVEWANEQGLMTGVGNNKFAPQTKISGATVVAVLSRLAKIDLNLYTDTAYADIPNDQWYSKAAKWAKSTGLLGTDPFQPNTPIVRGELAVILVKYLDQQGIKYEATGAAAVFSDASLMTAEQKTAFQVLYKLGIFNGKNNGVMDPKGATTRAELATLLHRVAVFVESHQSGE